MKGGNAIEQREYLSEERIAILVVRIVRREKGGITGLWQPSVHSDVAF